MPRVRDNRWLNFRDIELSGVKSISQLGQLPSHKCIMRGGSQAPSQNN